MPQFLAYTALMAQLEVDIVAAWPDTRKIYRGWPPLTPKVFPCAIIELDEANPLDQSQPAGAVAVWQVPRLRITRLAALPTDKSVGLMDQQIEEANALIALLEASGYYPSATEGPMQECIAGVGAIPEQAAMPEERYSVTVDFAGRIRQEYQYRS